MGLGGVLPSLEASSVELDWAGESSSVHPCSLSWSAAGAVGGQMGTVRGSCTREAGACLSPEGSRRQAASGVVADPEGRRPGVDEAGKAGMLAGTPWAACEGVAVASGGDCRR